MTTSSTPTYTTGQRDLAQRSSAFASTARTFVRRTPKTIASMGDCRRLIRSSGEIGSSYLDADHAVSKEAFASSIMQCCREARQARHWLALLDSNLDDKSEKLHAKLTQEAKELEKIFGSILSKVRAKKSV
ncbi:four helix bundle protein [Candidatus Peregrinibacteria bacterium CG10_big_fil_rev_8_21_14_0_10_49_24]|nr:MAG: four helix bundle protein [Candidatus Peregrinibacteria bacterium CG11_big_fil_rev_8_21_14_0_20_49_14]PIR50626.1 MAG: four helix bundle protein [Candidatus Peregrinibacteria bacterium CG10_big_fil_rev_8_21_14_0_10_49_24]PJA67056.1 MAG: four helix bundle protein [Candidatus Peregrinibacteria bacterium CG_4_9_14_3_um_filter_49_12]